MSVLGISFLNEIIKHAEITTAKDVLNEMREQIKLALKQTGKANETKDGMDMALCEINMSKKQLRFAGANSPVYIIRQTNDYQHDIIELKPDRMPLGIYINERETFSNQTIDIKNGDTLYMFSDGFADQRGGPDGSKFMYNAFREKLLEIQNLQLPQQAIELEKTLHNWMNYNKQTTYSQIDDILVGGFKIKF